MELTITREEYPAALRIGHLIRHPQRPHQILYVKRIAEEGPGPDEDAADSRFEISGRNITGSGHRNVLIRCHSRAVITRVPNAEDQRSLWTALRNVMLEQPTHSKLGAFGPHGVWLEFGHTGETWEIRPLWDSQPEEDTD